MQEPRTGSTLELMVNEQPLRTMSQIDLNCSTTVNQVPNLASIQQQQQSQQQQQQASDLFNFEHVKQWSARCSESFNAKLDEAKSKSNTRTEYVFEVIHAFSGLVIWSLCFLCTIIVPIILFFLGLTNLDDCPDRPSLPYLIFGIGFVMTASNLFNFAMAFDLPVLANHQLLSSDLKNTIASILNIIFNCVVAFLYILSAYMVFTITKHRQNNPVNTVNASNSISGVEDVTVESQPIECNQALYYFTYWFISLTIGFVAILSILATILYAYNRYRLNIIRGSTPRSQPTATNLSCHTNPAFMSSTNRL